MHLQSVMLLLPVSAMAFGIQSIHAATVVAAMVVEYVSIAQDVQVSSPWVGLKEPEMHAVHACPSLPVWPILQTQSVSSSLLGGETVCTGHSVHIVHATAAILAEYLFAGHGLQIPAPVEALYVPATHAVHASPFDGAVYPAGHLQFHIAPLPCADLVNAGQLRQFDSRVEAVVEEYVSTGHTEQVPTPAFCLNVPLSHAKH